MSGTAVLFGVLTGPITIWEFGEKRAWWTALSAWVASLRLPSVPAPDLDGIPWRLDLGGLVITLSALAGVVGQTVLMLLGVFVAYLITASMGLSLVVRESNRELDAKRPSVRPSRFAALNRSLAELYPERHLYVRSGGALRAFVLSSHKQMAIAAWVTFALASSATALFFLCFSLSRALFRLLVVV